MMGSSIPSIRCSVAICVLLIGPCQVKSESKRVEFKREIKCKDGIGANWHGEWTAEFWDGPCLVTQDVKPDEFKEEVKCERRRK
jgi:hypothetical protein